MLTWNLIISVLILDITCCVGGEMRTQKDPLWCTLRYLKYICSLTLMCLIHSFNNIYFDLQWTIWKLWLQLLCYAVDRVIPQYKNILKFRVYYSCTNSKNFQMSQFFNDPQPLDLEALEYVKTTWSKYFVTMYNTLG